MNNYRALIVDDEWLAREGLRRQLAQFPEIEIVGEADCVSAAVKAIRDVKPDVVFLDIQMPDDTGFALFDHVDVNFKVIFVTAFDEYAIRAFEVNALDYLLKPIHQTRLSQSIARLSRQAEKRNQIKDRLTVNDHIFIESRGRNGFVKVSSILYILAAGDYSEVFVKPDDKRMILRSLKEWEEYLPERTFLRIHRNTIINLNFVEKVEPWVKSTFQIQLKNIEEPFITSRKYAKELREKFSR